jgi:hypothetical protein
VQQAPPVGLLVSDRDWLADARQNTAAAGSLPLDAAEARLRRIFERVDRDSAGHLTRAELIQRLQTMVAEHSEIYELLQLPSTAVGEERRGALAAVFDGLAPEEGTSGVSAEHFVRYVISWVETRKHGTADAAREPKEAVYSSAAAVYEAITGFHGAHEFLSWNANRVEEWMREEVGLPDATSKRFEEQGVVGSRLTGLTEEQLKAPPLSVKSGLQRKKILMAIGKLTLDAPEPLGALRDAETAGSPRSPPLRLPMFPTIQGQGPATTPARPVRDDSLALPASEAYRSMDVPGESLAAAVAASAAIAEDGVEVQPYVTTEGKSHGAILTAARQATITPKVPLVAGSGAVVSQPLLDMNEVRLARDDPSKWAVSMHEYDRLHFHNIVTKERTFVQPACFRNWTTSEMLARQRSTTTAKDIADAAAAKEAPPGPKVGLEALDFALTDVVPFSGLPEDIYDIARDRPPPQLDVAREGRHFQPSIARPADYLKRSSASSPSPLSTSPALPALLFSAVYP